MTTSWSAEKQAKVFYKSLEGGKGVLKNLEIYWMKNKTITEFGFGMIWRIMQISEAVIHDLHNSSYQAQPH